MIMSGQHEDATPAAERPARGEQPPLVDSVPLFPTDAPPVPPLPSNEAPQPSYRRTRAAAREERVADSATRDAPVDSAALAEPMPPAPAAPAPATPARGTSITAPAAPAAPSAAPAAPQPRVAPAAMPGVTEAALAALPLISPTSAEANTRTPTSLPPRPAASDAAPAGSLASTPASRRDEGLRERHSFLQTERPEEPARDGARGVLNKLGFRVRPSAEEQSARDDELAVSQHWPGPRTIAVVNGKGGAGKTPTTILLSAVFARYGGAGVLAWDNNQTRGTLGWRTDTGAHDRTLLELLPEAGRLLGTGAQSADLAHFMHHQPREKYDVLRSKPIRLAHENRLSPGDVDSIHAVAAKFYRLIIIDSGNDESDPMWLRMIDHADQLVVATTTRADHAEAGALLLEALEERDERSARLARESVVVVSQADPKATAADIDHVVSGYGALSRDVVSIPFDHEMVDGHLRYGALAKRTQRAWLAAAASVARGL